METVLVERSFADPIEFATVQALEDCASRCFDLHKVRFLYSFFSTDRRRMICVYQAPDAEAVREANRKGGLPFDRVWTAQVIPGADGQQPG